MKNIKKISLITAGSLVATAAIAIPTTLALINNKPNTTNPAPSIGEVQSKTSTGFKLERISSSTSRSNEVQEQYKITIINNDEYGTITFEDGSNEKIVVPGEKVNLKVKVKDQYLDTHTIVNLEVYDEVNPNYSLGVEKIDENNYTFTMPNGGEDGKWFYQSGTIFAKITYGLKKLGVWEFDFKSKHYVLNVTQDNFVYDDVANPALQIQQYPSGSFVLFRIQLNNHNMIIKNMSIPKNVQFELCNTYNDHETTESSPIVSLAEGGKIDQQGSAGVWRGVRITRQIASEFNWYGLEPIAYVENNAIK